MIVIRISLKKTYLVVSYRNCYITSWFWRPDWNIRHMKLIKSNFLLHWKDNVSPFQLVCLFCALWNASHRRLECSVSNFIVKHSKRNPVSLDWLALKLVEIHSSKTFLTIYLSTWRNSPQDLNLHHYRYEKIKSGNKLVKPSYSLYIQVQIKCTCNICNGHY